MANKQDVAGAGATGAVQVWGALDPQSQLIAACITSSLGIGFATWSYFSEKRSRELFSSQEIVEKIISKIQASDDFASFTYSIWHKYNLESSATRRSYLKNFLEREAGEEKNDFQNFSNIEYIIQNISLHALQLLRVFNSKDIYGRFPGPGEKGFAGTFINRSKVIEILRGMKFEMHEQDVEYRLNELAHNNLIAISHGRMDGPWYNQSKLGFVLLEYIESSN